MAFKTNSQIASGMDSLEVVLSCSPSTPGAMLTLQHTPTPQETPQGCVRSHYPLAEIRVPAWELHAVLDSTGHLHSKEGSQEMCWGTSRESSCHSAGDALCSSCGWDIPHAAATALNPGSIASLLHVPVLPH